MAVEKKFVKTALADLAVKMFLDRELERAGVSKIEIQKTPIATRISIFVRRPGIVVGKKGKAIKELCDELTSRFAIENPQIEVVEVERPELDAKLVAERVGKQIELKPRIKPIMRAALREVMNSGALGAEIRVAGKVVGKGAKAKALTARAGYLKKSGEAMKLVNVGRYTAYLKAGAIGVTVRIVPPGTVFSDQVNALNLPETAPAALEAVEGGALGEASGEALSEEAKAEAAAVEKALGEAKEAAQSPSVASVKDEDEDEVSVEAKSDTALKASRKKKEARKENENA
ncbi:MAG: 30S ribosomal protein S3 [Candidatus Norongarragalinales archaeon]